jgi:hypothetical protein
LSPWPFFSARFLKIRLASFMKRLKTSCRGLGWRFRKKSRPGSSKSLISKNRLPSDFNVEVEGVDMEVLKHLCHEIQYHKHKFHMAPFKAFNLLIQERYDFIDMFKISPPPPILP